MRRVSSLCFEYILLYVRFYEWMGTKKINLLRNEKYDSFSSLTGVYMKSLIFYFIIAVLIYNLD